MVSVKESERLKPGEMPISIEENVDDIIQRSWRIVPDDLLVD